MLSREYRLYGITLSYVKAQTVRMNAFLLIPPFHIPAQIPNEWQPHTTIPFHPIHSALQHEHKRRDLMIHYLHTSSHSLRHVSRYTEQAIIPSFTRALQRKRILLSFAYSTHPIPRHAINTYRNPETANHHPESNRMNASHHRNTFQIQMQYT